MLIPDPSPTLPLSLRIAQVIGTTAPAMFASLTFAYSHLIMPLIAQHTPDEKLLAKQWLHAYQFAPRFVSPLILSGTISNAFLAIFPSNSPLTRALYASAALLTLSVMPVTFLYFEPHINGAGKWKVQQVLRRADEKFDMEENGRRIPSVYRHTGTPGARKWAEGVGMKEIAEEWGRLNRGRYAVTAVASVVSAVATCWCC